MNISSLLLSITILLVSPLSLACRFVQDTVPKLDERNLSEGFVGIVMSVNKEEAIFYAPRKADGAAQPPMVHVPIMKNACGIRFEAGQTWIYFGNALYSGSYLLQDQWGRVTYTQDTVKFQKLLESIMKKTQFPIDAYRARGKIFPQCAPLGGVAFSIKLEPPAKLDWNLPKDFFVTVYADLPKKTSFFSYEVPGTQPGTQPQSSSNHTPNTAYISNGKLGRVWLARSAEKFSGAISINGQDDIPFVAEMEKMDKMDKTTRRALCGQPR